MTDITFRANYEYSNADELVEAQKTALNYLLYLKKSISVSVIKHANFNSDNTYYNAHFQFIKGRNHFFYLPFKSCFLVRRSSSDIILVQGLGFPWQLIMLRLFVGNKTNILVQHHGELPFTGIKRFFQKWADTYVTAYLFTASGNAKKWIDDGIIPKEKTCYEVLEASTFFERKDKEQSLAKCKMSGNSNFIWVGRLNKNKDPLTVVNAFVQYLVTNAEAKLYMIYQTDELLDDIRQTVQQAGILDRSVFLVGKVEHDDLPFWFSAANYYLSGSYREGSGYALLEAMSCGCIPIVTNIPSFRKITDYGKYGYLFDAGNKEQLIHILEGLGSNTNQVISDAIVMYAKKNLSFQSIASAISDICETLLAK